VTHERKGGVWDNFRRIEERLGAAGAEGGEGRRPLTEEDLFREYRTRAQDLLTRKFTLEDLARRFDPEFRERARRAIFQMLEAAETGAARPVMAAASALLVRDLLGYGPLDRYFADPAAASKVTEVRVVRWDRIRVQMEGEWHWSPEAFRSEAHCREVLERILAPTGRRIDLANPRASARLLDGSRLMAHIPPASPNGTTFSIRKFLVAMRVRPIVERGSMPPELAAFLGACVLAKLNFVVTGGTNTGKTSLMTALINDFVPEQESIVTCEDPVEMQFALPDVRQLEARPPNVEGQGEITLRTLVADALRMSPTRILVSECRKAEAFDMIQAMNTGHPGSATTVHANDAWQGIRRLSNLLQMAEADYPYEAILETLADALDLVIHLAQLRGGRRVVDHVCEVGGLERTPEGLRVGLRVLWRYDRKADCWERVGAPSRKLAELEDALALLPAHLERAGLDPGLAAAAERLVAEGAGSRGS
jgi:pilus assembly protein CpaF